MILNIFEVLFNKYFINKDENFNASTDYKEISQLEINDNIVSADIVRLDGNENHIEIKFKEFSSREKGIIDNYIHDNPLVFYKIMNNIFPEELLDLDVKLFPTSALELNVKCSCNESAELCKDAFILLKALEYKIKNDLFLIFTLRGMDLSKNNINSIKSINEILNYNYDFFKSNSCGFDSPLLKSENPNHLNLEFLSADLFNSLKEEIKSFKTLPTAYVEYYRFHQFMNPVFVSDESELTKLFNKKWQLDDVRINFDESYRMERFGYIRNERALFGFLNELSQVDIENVSVNIQFLYELLNFTFKLIESDSIFPQLFTLLDGRITLRWIPIINDKSLLNLFNSFCEKCPDNLVRYNREELLKETQVIVAISFIVEGFIQYYLKEYKVKFNDKLPKDIYDIFFALPVDLEDEFITSNVNELYDILSFFNINSLDWEYVFLINKLPNKFQIEIKIKNEDKIKSIDKANSSELYYTKLLYYLFSRYNLELDLFDKIILSEKDFEIFYLKIKPILEKLNIKINMPFEICEADLNLMLSFNFKKDYTLDSLNNHQWKINFNGKIISIDEFKRMAAGKKSFFKLGSDFIFLSEKKVDEINFKIDNIPEFSTPYDLVQFSILGENNDVKYDVDEKFKNIINVYEDIEVPKSLNATLRPYQKEGFSWLVHNIKTGFGCVLADDMGLGKTVQVLSAILYLKENHYLVKDKVLIIVPVTLLINWTYEIKKFAPDLSFEVYHGINRRLKYTDSDVVITTYGIIREDIDIFLEKSWFLCVIDEAHAIKNPKTRQSKLIKSLKANNKIALTGTPIENRLTDLWSIFDFINNGYLLSFKDFKKNYLDKIEKNHDDEALNNFKKLTSPFILRRLKSDKTVIKDLPYKIVSDVYCDLTPKQNKLYNIAFDDIFDDIEYGDKHKRSGLIFKLLTALKQICNHPSQYLKSERPKINESGKMNTLTDLLHNILDVDEKVVIFTQYLKMGEILEDVISKRFKCNVVFINGELSVDERDEYIDKFQNDEDYPILISTLKTGGVGLNLTAANSVIHYDLWWNPAVENQATDRVYRIGQKENVMVYRLITTGTLEEKIDKIIKDKLELVGKAIDSETTLISEMSDEELRELLSLRG